MNSLVTAFQPLVGHGTHQNGRYYCIPAVLSNAIKALGGRSPTQQDIEDLWYKTNQSVPETSIDDRMRDAGPGVISTTLGDPRWSAQYGYETFDRPTAASFFDSQKSDDALAFIEGHTAQDHPVLVSTDHIPWEQGILQRLCCHMWLVLYCDRANNLAIAHDPGTDLLFRIPIGMTVSIALGGKTQSLEIGLRGRLTTTNYYCCAFWKK